MAANPEEKTAATFRHMFTSETARLTTLCERWEATLASLEQAANTSEEILGQVRTTIGQGRLLMNRKGRFEQFRGLVDACENGTGEKPTTVMDLQGFWDMVYFQIEDVDRKFVELTEMEKNGWVAPVPAVVVSKPTPPRKMSLP